MPLTESDKMILDFFKTVFPFDFRIVEKNDRAFSGIGKSLQYLDKYDNIWKNIITYFSSKVSCFIPYNEARQNGYFSSISDCIFEMAKYDWHCTINGLEIPLPRDEMETEIYKEIYRWKK